MYHDTPKLGTVLCKTNFSRLRGDEGITHLRRGVIEKQTLR